MIDRRRFLGALAVTAIVPFSGAQPAGKVYRIGYIQTATPDEQAHLTKAFEEGLRIVPGFRAPLCRAAGLPR